MLELPNPLINRGLIFTNTWLYIPKWPVNNSETFWRSLQFSILLVGLSFPHITLIHGLCVPSSRTKIILKAIEIYWNYMKIWRPQNLNPEHCCTVFQDSKHASFSPHHPGTPRIPRSQQAAVDRGNTGDFFPAPPVSSHEQLQNMVGLGMQRLKSCWIGFNFVGKVGELADKVPFLQFGICFRTHWVSGACWHWLHTWGYHGVPESMSACVCKRTHTFERKTIFAGRNGPNEPSNMYINLTSVSSHLFK